MRKKSDKLADRKNKIVTFGINNLAKHMTCNLESGKSTVLDVRFKDIKSIYKTMYAPKIDKGYRILFEYNGVKKILIYN